LLPPTTRERRERHDVLDWIVTKESRNGELRDLELHQPQQDVNKPNRLLSLQHEFAPTAA
jgi:hypothetical protein